MSREADTPGGSEGTEGIRRESSSRREALDVEAVTLEGLLSAGEVEGTLILKGKFTPDEIALARTAYEHGFKQGKATARTDIEDIRRREVDSLRREKELREAIHNASYFLNPNQGEPADPSLASQWLRTTFPKDHPNYIDPAALVSAMEGDAK